MLADFAVPSLWQESMALSREKLGISALLIVRDVPRSISLMNFTRAAVYRRRDLVERVAVEQAVPVAPLLITGSVAGVSE